MRFRLPGGFTARPARKRPGAAVLTVAQDNGEALVLNRESGNYHGLNTTAYFLWRGIEAGVDGEELSRAYAEHFDVDIVAARRDLDSMLAQLRHRGVLNRQSGKK